MLENIERRIRIQSYIIFDSMEISRTINVLSTAISTSTTIKHLIKSNQQGLIKPNQLQSV